MQKHIYIATSIFMLVYAAFFLQTKMIFNGDVAWLLHDTQLMLSGGTYTTSFFETNPPMIFYLYTPIVLFSSFTHIDLLLTATLYFIMVALLSTVCCNYLMKQIINDSHAFLRYVFTYALLSSYLFIPSGLFGQREHIYIMFLMPYIICAAITVENKKIPALLACLIGITLGLGTGMKPYFLAPIILIEFYIMLKKRNLFSWLRIEIITCSAVLLFYLIHTIIAWPEYFKVIMPLVSHLYFIGTKQTWYEFLSTPYIIFLPLPYICYFTLKQFPYKNLLNILILALTGAIIAFTIPRTAWYYHAIPAIIICCVFITLYCTIILNVTNGIKNLYAFSTYTASLSILLFFPILNVYELDYMFLSPQLNDNKKALINFITQKKATSIYCFSGNTTADCFPLTTLTNTQFGGRIPFFWWLRGMLQLEQQNLPVKDKVFLLDTTANDINSYKPQFVIINNFDETYFMGKDFNFIRYFSTNKNFSTAWKHYEYLTTIGHYGIYQRKEG